jgi:hypothetical protein
MRQINYYLAVILLFVLSCRKEVEFNGSTSKPVLVVNGIVENDSLFRVNIERSVFFLDQNQNQSKIISDATVTVRNETTNEVFTMTSSTFESLYEFPFVTTPNTNYSIEVNRADYTSVSAQTTTTSKIEIMSIDTTSFEQNENNYYYGKRLQVDLKFNDPQQENYYMIRVLQKYNNEWGGGEYYLSLNTIDASVDKSDETDIDGTPYDLDYLIFGDKLFNGQEKTIRFNFYHPFEYYGEDEESSINITLIAMNKETYLYFRSMKKNSSSDFFSEPVKVYSNIENGYGIFGTLNYSTFVLSN